MQDIALRIGRKNNSHLRINVKTLEGISIGLILELFKTNNS
jgi:hypothetical protein